MNFRRGLIGSLLGFGAVLCAWNAPALAQEKYPSRPLKIIVPLQAGGAIDVFVRALAKEFENRTGGSVVVENRAGANTIIAANACKSAAPDGYTICLLTRSTVSINPELYKKLSYDPLKDFEPITNAFFGQQIVILNKNVPVNTFAELVEYSKKNPDKLNFASMGLGGDSHLIMEWLKHTSGAKIAHVPYKGFPEAMTSFKANDIQLIALLVGNPDLARQIRDGEVKGLLLPGSKRSELVPAVPTFAEVRPARRPDRLYALVWPVRAEGNAGRICRQAQQRVQRHHDRAGIPRAPAALEGIHADRHQARRVRQIPGRGPQGRSRARRDIRREARGIASMLWPVWR